MGDGRWLSAPFVVVHLLTRLLFLINLKDWVFFVP
jgi:hypothetical protein